MKKTISRMRLKNLKKRIKVPKEFIRKYNKEFSNLKNQTTDFNIYKNLRYDVGEHQISYVDYECRFVANQMSKINQNNISILDIGSYRHFILGLLSYYKVTTIDIRERESRQR